jgi:hypothetical protein
MTNSETVREISTWRALGLTDEITTCDHCGRDDLKATVRMVLVDADGGQEGEQFMGTACAARMTGRKVAEIRTEAARADRERVAAERAAAQAERDARDAAERADFCAWVLARYGVTITQTGDLWAHEATTGLRPFQVFKAWQEARA